MKTNCSLTQEEIDEVEKRFKHLRIKFIIYAVLKPAPLIVALKSIFSHGVPLDGIWPMICLTTESIMTNLSIFGFKSFRGLKKQALSNIVIKKVDTYEEEREASLLNKS